jgi:hypothetical protein
MEFVNSDHEAFFLGQHLYTPSDIEDPLLLEDDRPYGGWLYLGWRKEIRKEDVMDSFEIQTGIVGPSSYADETQIVIHKWIDSQEPMGWDHQLEDEFGLVLSARRHQRVVNFPTLHGVGSDMIVSGAGVLGNVFTFAEVGFCSRLGYHLPDQIGEVVMAPRAARSVGEKLSAFGFIGAKGRYVLRNIFLDGNTFKDSHSVDKEPLVLDVYVGGSVRLWGANVIYSKTYRSKEFEGQEEDNIFSSLTMSWIF